MLDRTFLWNLLKKHMDHAVEIACYGDKEAPSSITLEDMDTNEVLFAAEDYTLVSRKEPEVAIPYDTLMGMFADYVALDAEAAEPEYIREMLESVGVTEELASVLGMEEYFEEEE